jgi:hypothetical protein
MKLWWQLILIRSQIFMKLFMWSKLRSLISVFRIWFNVYLLTSYMTEISMSSLSSVVTLWDNLGQRSNPYFSKKCYQILTISFLRTFFVIFIHKTVEVTVFIRHKLAARDTNEFRKGERYALKNNFSIYCIRF